MSSIEFLARWAMPSARRHWRPSMAATRPFALGPLDGDGTAVEATAELDPVGATEADEAADPPTAAERGLGC